MHRGTLQLPALELLSLFLIPFFPFSPLVEIHQSLDSMTAEISLNSNYSVCFFASLQRAEKLLQPQNILLGWCFEMDFLSPSAGRRLQGLKAPSVGQRPSSSLGAVGFGGVWWDLGMFSPWSQSESSGVSSRVLLVFPVFGN